MVPGSKPCRDVYLRNPCPTLAGALRYAHVSHVVDSGSGGTRVTAIDWGEVIKALGGQAVFLGAAGYLVKEIVSHRLSKQAEEFKVQLESRAAVEVERLKASLQLVATEHQIQFAKLHEKRALVIAELYTRLIETRRTAGEFILGDVQDPERSASAMRAVW